MPEPDPAIPPFRWAIFVCAPIFALAALSLHFVFSPSSDVPALVCGAAAILFLAAFMFAPTRFCERVGEVILSVWEAVSWVLLFR